MPRRKRTNNKPHVHHESTSEKKTQGKKREAFEMNKSEESSSPKPDHIKETGTVDLQVPVNRNTNKGRRPARMRLLPIHIRPCRYQVLNVDPDKPFWSVLSQAPEPVAGGSGLCEAPEPVAGGSGLSQAPEPVTGGSGLDQAPEPVAGESGLSQALEPVTGGSGLGQAPKPVAGGSGLGEAPEPVTGGSGLCQDPKPAKGSSRAQQDPLGNNQRGRQLVTPERSARYNRSMRTHDNRGQKGTPASKNPDSTSSSDASGGSVICISSGIDAGSSSSDDEQPKRVKPKKQ